jgi:small conductance mechanosensitive channel
VQGGVVVQLRSLLGTVLDNLELLDKIPEYTLGVAVFTVSLAVVYAIGRFMLEPLTEHALRVRNVNLTIRGAILRVVRAGIWFVGVLLALDLAGAGVFGASATLAAALTIAVGFATRDIASNLVGGVFIVTDPRFNIGDWIEWEGNEGAIEDITFRVTRSEPSTTNSSRCRTPCLRPTP